jgi:hypothetical protein
MKRTILAIGVLMAVGSGAGAVAATRGTNVTFVVQLRGDAYVAHRQLLLAEKVEDIERADFGISKAGGLLQETLLRRKAASPFLARIDVTVNRGGSTSMLFGMICRGSLLWPAVSLICGLLTKWIGSP